MAETLEKHELQVEGSRLMDVVIGASRSSCGSRCCFARAYEEFSVVDGMEYVCEVTGVLTGEEKV